MSTARRSEPERPVRSVGRLEQRRERILREAERVFMQHGYAGASINEIARLAGGSLATLYNEFGSKEGLFAQVVRSRVSSIFVFDMAQCSKSRSVRGGLLQLANRVLERILRDDSLAFYRICVSEGPRFPEVRKAVLEGSFPAYIAALGAALVDLGVTTPAQSAEAAEELTALVHGQLVFRAACGDGRTISAKQRAKQVERAVDAFLKLHPPR
jgi:AcrR family transcriptional regulator